MVPAGNKDKRFSLVNNASNYFLFSKILLKIKNFI